MMENENKKIITKSPGKSLLSGGYLILDKSKRGLVINIDTYISCESFYIIKERPKNDIKNNFITFNVNSEYLNQTFNYIVFLESIINDEYEIKISEKNNNDNKWIKNCIISSLIFYLSFFDFSKNLFNEKEQLEINVVIKSDYRFYSYSKENISEKIKTGLGSSSAFINSLTSNLIIIYEKFCRKKNYAKNLIFKDINDKDLQALILGSCLLSNNLSQNKIGSCFDIISSLFGSQIFIQSQNNIFFNSPLIISQENKDKINNFIAYLKKEYIPKISFINEKNKYLQSKIYLISIEIGTDTRIYVKKVLEYANSKKKEKLYDDELFSNLNEINEKIINNFMDESKEDNYLLLKQLCIRYRTILREISQQSKVDIEPRILTPLLDNLIKNDKIIYAICPGAGGYDSIVIIAKYGIDESELIKDINNIINDFNLENNNKKLNIKANLLDVNIAKIAGTILS